MRAILLLFVVSIPLAGCVKLDALQDLNTAPCEDTFADKVERIVDGDTIDLTSCGRVRLALVDTPESDEEGFEAANAFTRRVCPIGLEARIDQDAGQPIDTTGTRIVAVVVCDGKTLNGELVWAGHAVILTRFCDVSEFAGEEWAREACGPGT